MKLFFSVLFCALISNKLIAQNTVIYHVAGISISGNKITKDDIVLREIVLHENDSVTTERLYGAIQSSEKNLSNTGLFHTQKIKDSISKNDVYIKVTVTEKWYVWPEPVLSFQADRNFNEWWLNKNPARLSAGIPVNWYNFRGRNERLKLNIVLGWHQTLGLSYKIPYINKAKTLGIHIVSNYELGHEIAYDVRKNKQQFFKSNNAYIFKYFNAELKTTYRPKYSFNHNISLGYDNYSVADTVSKLNREYLGNGLKNFSSYYATYEIIYENRNFFFNPTKGNYASLELNEYMFSSSWLTTAILTLKNYYTIKNVTIGNGVQLAYGSRLSSPYVYKNSLGYRKLVRGYEHYVIAGQNYFISNNEVKYKLLDTKLRIGKLSAEEFNTIPLQIYVKTFGDGAYVQGKNEKENTFLNTWLYSYGVGLDFFTYYDKILRVEYAINKMKEKEVFLHYIVAF